MGLNNTFAHIMPEPDFFDFLNCPRQIHYSKGISNEFEAVSNVWFRWHLGEP